MLQLLLFAVLVVWKLAMMISEIVGIGAIAVGSTFFCIAVVGVLIPPDVYTRLHALTKVDNHHR